MNRSKSHAHTHLPFLRFGINLDKPGISQTANNPNCEDVGLVEKIISDAKEEKSQSRGTKIEKPTLLESKEPTNKC